MSKDTTILVVDDDALLRCAIVYQMEDEGFRVLEAESASKAIELLEQNSRISLLLTDIEMPGTFDGVRLAAIARDRWPLLKIVVMSARSPPDNSQLPIDSVFLKKPYDHRDIMRVFAGC
ncbi:MAG: response regulator [Devosia sp.]